MSGTVGTWLAIVGIGEDGVDGLSGVAREAIGAAEHVFGGARHLALAAPLIRGAAHPWPRPFCVHPVLALRGRRVCVLASGEPFWHGVGATLAQNITPAEMRVFASPSAFALAAHRVGWALHEVATVSLHGLPVERLRPLLSPRRRILALTSDGGGPAAVAALLVRHGFGPSRLTVLEALGGPDERTVELRADAAVPPCHPLNVVALTLAATPGARAIPLAPGLPDDWFQHDGQISKREVRALALAALAPLNGATLWDVGAGAGSVAIEWLLAGAGAAVAIERDAARAARIRRNAAAFGVPLAVVEGVAPAALAGLPRPDAAFVGGGASDPAVLDTVLAALPEGGRLVAHAVTLETEAALIARRARHGGTLTRIDISHAGPLGGMTVWRPALAVVAWAITVGMP